VEDGKVGRRQGCRSRGRYCIGIYLQWERAELRYLLGDTDYVPLGNVRARSDHVHILGRQHMRDRYPDRRH
jgi:hypothetical protein